jgi:hypothetical protein
MKQAKLLLFVLLFATVNIQAQVAIGTQTPAVWSDSSAL